jgi:hypothetical protein
MAAPNLVSVPDISASTSMPAICPAPKLTAFAPA